MTDKLRECPFCGSADVKAHSHYVRCEKCFSEGPTEMDKEYGIKAWQNRAPSQLVAELREAVDLLGFYEGCNEKPPAHQPNKRPWVEINYEDFMEVLTKLKATLAKASNQKDNNQ